MISSDYHFRKRDVLVGAQMLLIAFGALVLVPLLTGLDPNVALFTAGLGTLIFQVVTKGKVPVFLASSFAFIAPIIYGSQTWGLPATMSGLCAAGLLYVVLSWLIRKRGKKLLDRVLPSIVTGPVIMIIGLVLAPVAVHMATGKTSDGTNTLFDTTDALWVSMSALAATVFISLLGKGFFRLLPVLGGMVVGYTFALFFGMVDFTSVRDASVFALPQFTLPVWNWEAVVFILPVAIAPAIEHVGDILAIGEITKKNYVADPGVHRTLLGDGLATIAASMIGGPPNTTYSEVTGGVALTKAYNPAIMTWASIVAILLSFLEKLGAFLQSIPTPVIGGILILLFGTITVVGMNVLVRSKEDLLKSRNLAIVGIILVFGIGGMSFSAGEFVLKGVGLAGVLGVVLNLILPQERAEKSDSARKSA